MFRSWSERLLGGVCGGLSERIGLSAWTWRLLFVLLTLLTGGWVALVYLLWWWLLPLNIPNAVASRFFPTILALASAIVIVGGYVLRESLVTESGASLYVPIVGVVVTGVFFLRQLGRRGSVVIALVMLLTAIVALLAVLGVLGAGVDDLLVRSIGGLLIFLGLALLLRERVPFGSIVAALVSVALVGGVGFLAYSSRISQQRDENTFEKTFTVAAEVTTLQLNLTTLDTDVRVASAPPNARDIKVTFVGSLASTIQQTYSADGVLATLDLTETRGEGLPSLENIGRGTITIELPQGVAVAVAFAGVNGSATFDMGQLNLERLNMDLQTGNAVITFPLYQPLSPSVAQSPGELLVRNGDLRLVVPPTVGGQFLINKSTNERPLFDDLIYALEDNLNEWLLTARQYENAPAKIRYIITVPRAQIRLDTAQSGA